MSQVGMTRDEAYAAINSRADQAEEMMAVLAGLTDSARVTFRCHPHSVQTEARWAVQIARFGDADDSYAAFTRTAFGGTLLEAVAAALVADEKRRPVEMVW